MSVRLRQPRAPRGRSWSWRKLVREANHATHRGNERRGGEVRPEPTRCECGDPECERTLAMSRVDFEALCATPDRYLSLCRHADPLRSTRPGGGAVVEEVGRESTPVVLPVRQAAA